MSTSSSLKEGYSDRALCWETLAQRHWVDTKHDTLTGIHSHSHSSLLSLYPLLRCLWSCPTQTLRCRLCVCVCLCVRVARGTSDDELCAVEKNTEKCYREGLEVVSEPSSLWRYYIQWCQKRVEDKHVTDAARLRVSWPFVSQIEKGIISRCYLTELANMTPTIVCDSNCCPLPPRPLQDC